MSGPTSDPSPPGAAGAAGDGASAEDVPEPGRSRRPRAQDSVPGLARFAASAAWHTTQWGVRTSARTGARVVRAATSAEEAGALLDDLSDTVGGTVGTVGDLLRTAVFEATAAVSALDARLEAALDPRSGDACVEEQPPSEDPPPTLREQGQDLLRRSRAVGPDEGAHPAFGRILGELAPDEARVLLLLLEAGPQPSVDVRTGGPTGLVSSQLVAPGLSMIGSRAGCRAPSRVPAYLNNLFRLGLVWFSREALRDHGRYQVLEAQPDVLAALHSVRFAKVVRRSIHLTPFGEDFCRTCLVESDRPGVEYPRHDAPGNDEPTSPAGR